MGEAGWLRVKKRSVDALDSGMISVLTSLKSLLKFQLPSSPGQKATLSLCLPLNSACTLSSAGLLALITLLIFESSINIHRL